MKKLALIAIAGLISGAVFAQSNEPAPSKYDATWHRLVMVDFKPGKVGDAKKIIEKYQSAGEKAGTPAPQQYWMETGKYDMLLIWDMKGGPSDMEWDWSPDGVKWFKALVEQEGSREAAEKLQNQYSMLVAGSTSEIMRMDK